MGLTSTELAMFNNNTISETSDVRAKGEPVKTESK